MNKMFQKSLALILAVCTSATMAVSAAAAGNDLAVTITGDVTIGSILTAAVTDSGVTVDSGITYQWIRDSGDVEISGANSKTYKLVEADKGYKIKVAVEVGQDEATSNAIGPVTDSGDVTDPEEPGEADKTALTNAIAAANKNLTETKTSEVDGTDIAKTVKWVTQAVKDTYSAAINDAQDVVDATDATATDVTDAETALEAATETFNSKKQFGTSTTALDLTDLGRACDEAGWLKDNTVVSISAANVPVGTKWVTQAEQDALKAVLTIAWTAHQNPSTIKDQAEVVQLTADLNKAIAEFKAAMKDGTKSTSTGGGSSSGSSGGSSSGSSGGSSSSSSGTSSTSSTTPTVSSSTAAKTATTAVADAVKQAVTAGAASANADVGFKNVEKMTPEAFQAINAAAAKASGDVNVKVTVQMDTVVGGKVAARLYIDPVAAAKLTAPINTLVDTNAKSKDNAAVAKIFDKYFSNEFAVATFGQKGSFGMSVPAALKLDLSPLNTASLKFYSYDKATNTVSEIAAPAYFVDASGYVHFTTPVGGSIVVTDKPLTQK